MKLLGPQLRTSFWPSDVWQHVVSQTVLVFFLTNRLLDLTIPIFSWSAAAYLTITFLTSVLIIASPICSLIAASDPFRFACLVDNSSSGVRLIRCHIGTRLIGSSNHYTSVITDGAGYWFALKFDLD